MSYISSQVAVDKKLREILATVSIGAKDATDSNKDQIGWGALIKINKRLHTTDAFPQFKPLINEKRLNKKTTKQELTAFNGQWILVKEEENEEQKVQDEADRILSIIKVTKEGTKEGTPVNFLYSPGMSSLDLQKQQTPVEGYRCLTQDSGNYGQDDDEINREKNQVLYVTAAFSSEDEYNFGILYTRFQLVDKSDPDNPVLKPQVQINLKWVSTVKVDNVDQNVEYLIDLSIGNTEKGLISKDIYKRNRVYKDVFVPITNEVYYIRNIYSKLYLDAAYHKNIHEQIQQTELSYGMSQQFELKTVSDQKKSTDANNTYYTFKSQLKEDTIKYFAAVGSKKNGERLKLSNNAGQFKLIPSVNGGYFIISKKKENKDKDKYLEITTRRPQERFQFWQLDLQRISKQSFELVPVNQKKKKN